MNTLDLFGVPGIMIPQFGLLILVTTLLMRELCPQRLDGKPTEEHAAKFILPKKTAQFSSYKAAYISSAKYTYSYFCYTCFMRLGHANLVMLRKRLDSTKRNWAYIIKTTNTNLLPHTLRTLCSSCMA